MTAVILAAMKTASSIPDDIFDQAERLAKARGSSRGEAYATAVSAFVANERFQSVRERLDALHGGGTDESGLDPALANAQAESVAGERW